MNKVAIGIGFVGYVLGVLVLFMKFGWLAALIGFLACASAGGMAIGMAEYERKYDDDEEER